MKTEPRRLGFHFLAQIPPPSHISHSPPPSPSTSAYPAPNRSPLSINDTPHAQFLKAKPLWLSILFSLHFWSIAPIFAFSTIHQLVFAPVYILLLLHMHVHHQYTILGVQFRCVISWYGIEIELLAFYVFPFVPDYIWEWHFLFRISCIEILICTLLVSVVFIIIVRAVLKSHKHNKTIPNHCKLLLQHFHLCMLR